jgi:hypothetical protein
LGHASRTGWDGLSYERGKPGIIHHGKHNIEVGSDGIKFDHTPVGLKPDGSGRLPDGTRVKAERDPKTGQFKAVTFMDGRGKGLRISFDEKGDMSWPPEQVSPPRSGRDLPRGPAHSPVGKHRPAGNRGASGHHGAGGARHPGPRPLELPGYSDVMRGLDGIAKKQGDTTLEGVRALHATFSKWIGGIKSHHTQLTKADQTNLTNLYNTLIAAIGNLDPKEQKDQVAELTAMLEELDGALREGETEA